MTAFQRLGLYAGALALGSGFAILFGIYGFVFLAIAVAVALILVLAATFEKVPEPRAALPGELAEAQAAAEAERLAAGGRAITQRERSEIVRLAQPPDEDEDGDVG